MKFQIMPRKERHVVPNSGKGGSTQLRQGQHLNQPKTQPNYVTSNFQQSTQSKAMD